MRELIINGEKTSYELKRNRAGELEITIEGESFIFDDWSKSANHSNKRVKVNGKNVTLWRAGNWTSFSDTLVEVKSARSDSRNKSGGADEGAMVSPMPGKILKVMAEIGKKVAAGEGLLVMEAMKMEHTIKANSDGIVSAIHCGEGDLVDGGVELVSIEANED